jgi:hypothetical protein
MRAHLDSKPIDGAAIGPDVFLATHAGMGRISKRLYFLRPVAAARQCLRLFQMAVALNETAPARER